MEDVQKKVTQNVASYVSICCNAVHRTNKRAWLIQIENIITEAGTIEVFREMSN